jgi:hypothetical protein
LDDARSENERLRNALVLIANVRQQQYAPGKDARSLARAALEPESQFPSLASGDSFFVTAIE